MDFDEVHYSKPLQESVRDILHKICVIKYLHKKRRAQLLRGRASDSQLSKPRFESCAAVLKPWASFSLYIAPVHSTV